MVLPAKTPQLFTLLVSRSIIPTPPIMPDLAFLVTVMHINTEFFGSSEAISPAPSRSKTMLWLDSVWRHDECWTQYEIHFSRSNTRVWMNNWPEREKTCHQSGAEHFPNNSAALARCMIQQEGNWPDHVHSIQENIYHVNLLFVSLVKWSCWTLESSKSFEFISLSV